METSKTESKTQKSTLLLVLFLFILFNAVQFCRTGINSLFFTEDISGDYAPIEATVVDFSAVTSDTEEKEEKYIPVFSFMYKEKKEVMEAPDFVFDAGKQLEQPFQKGEEYSLWVHKRWGKLMVPPVMGPEELGRSQLKISAAFLIMAVAVWILRNKLAKKVEN
jgi:hypothetical protein